MDNGLIFPYRLCVVVYEPSEGSASDWIEVVSGGSPRCRAQARSDRTLGQEKIYHVKAQSPVPQTDTGRRVENTKASGRTFVKELGKNVP